MDGTEGKPRSIRKKGALPAVDALRGRAASGSAIPGRDRGKTAPGGKTVDIAEPPGDYKKAILKEKNTPGGERIGIGPPGDTYEGQGNPVSAVGDKGGDEWEEQKEKGRERK
jgi:hypothetical protein